MMRNPTLAANNTGVGNRWTDASVTIASGHVLLTPPESNQLHCLNLLDGKLLWQKSREDGIYVGCVHEDKVLVVGRNMVRALGLRDGTPAGASRRCRSPSAAFPAAAASSTAAVTTCLSAPRKSAAIDIDSGQIVARSKSRTGASRAT